MAHRLLLRLRRAARPREGRRSHAPRAEFGSLFHHTDPGRL